MKQTSFFSNKQILFHGGDLFKGKRKTRRPLSTKAPLHLVLKSKKQLNLSKNSKIIQTKIHRYAKKFGIKIYDLSVQWDHIHICLRIHNRELYNKFIRSLTGVLARILGSGIWKSIPFTRIGHWGKGFKIIKNYILQNELEIHGVIPYQPRKAHYKKYLDSC